MLHVENRHEGSALQLRCEHLRASDRCAQTLGTRIDHHAVVSKSAGRRHVRWSLTPVLKPEVPGHIPTEVVQQRPAMEVRRSAGSAIRVEEGRAADRDHQFFEQGFFEHFLYADCIPSSFPGLALVGDPGIEIAPGQVDTVVVGFQNNCDLWVG